MNDDEQGCHVLPTVSRFTFRPMSITGPWWFRSAWAGWYWLEASVIIWDQHTYPNEPGATFTITLRLRGRVWTLKWKRAR